jgi:hypothetical protein
MQADKVQTGGQNGRSNAPQISGLELAGYGSSIKQRHKTDGEELQDFAHSWRGRKIYISRRPSMAFNMVISSAYSISLPTGMPIAMRVTLRPARRNCPER